MRRKTEREWALDLIMQVLEPCEGSKGIHCDTVLHQIFEEQDLSSRSRAFIKRLSYGVIERKIELDAIISRFSKIKGEKMKPLIRNVLRMGIYELRYMEQIPASATCNEAVRIVSGRGLHGLKGFVNGILRTAVREGTDIPGAGLPVRYSVPEWLFEQLVLERGRQDTVCMLESFFRQRPVTLRINRSKISLADYMDKLERQNIRWKRGSYMEDALCLSGNVNITELPGYWEGEFAIQDESSMLPVRCAGIRPGQIILDLCAAPGGKTFQAAEYIGQNGMVYARDRTPYKVRKMQENAIRLGIENVRFSCADASVFDETMHQRADVVLADVPCSGIGIIGRKPDIKYHISEQGCKELAVIQRKILSQAVRYVKPGGVLIYSTCTISRAENEDNAAFAARHLPLHLESMKEFLPESLLPYERDGMLQILPGIHNSDGFFVARFVRKMEHE